MVQHEEGFVAEVSRFAERDSSEGCLSAFAGVVEAGGLSSLLCELVERLAYPGRSGDGRDATCVRHRRQNVAAKSSSPYGTGRFAFSQPLGDGVRSVAGTSGVCGEV